MALQLEKRLFTVDEYQRMIETGILTEDDRVELIKGEVVKMPSIGPARAAPLSFLRFRRKVWYNRHTGP